MKSTDEQLYSIDEFLQMSGPRCAVLGRPIQHSRSPQIHQAGYRELGLDFRYVRVEAGDAREFRQLLTESDGDVRGFSVTMPGKSLALEMSDVATERALRIGSANTLVHREDGTWLSDNTDVDGVCACLVAVASQHREGQWESFYSGRHAVIVGNGGTARPAVAALANMGISRVTVVARSERALNLQGLVQDFGMSFDWVRLGSPDVERLCEAAAVVISTIPNDAASEHGPHLLAAGSRGGLVDVIYDPYPTDLMRLASVYGMPYADGLRMLAGQAEEQFRLFTGSEPSSETFLRAVREG